MPGMNLFSKVYCPILRMSDFLHLCGEEKINQKKRKSEKGILL